MSVKEMPAGTVTGRSIIAGVPTDGKLGQFRSRNPRTGEPIEPAFTYVGADEVDRAAAAARQCFDTYRELDIERRARFLETAAAELEAMRDSIVARASLETGLGEVRLNSELTRTTRQLRLFAQEVRLGAFHGVRHDPAPDHPDALARPDLRLRRIPLGPVAVFGASNFPLAFSTAGGDTASALAAGCPVIVKGHSAHAGTAELAGQALSRAAALTGMPDGVFSLLFGPGEEVGQELAKHPAISAIAFTGSQATGTALMATAAARPVPIPVYAEMSSVNPVVCAPGIGDDDTSRVAAGFVSSLTLGSGQFCTNPGILFVPPHSDHLIDAIADAITHTVGQVMLTPNIRASFDSGLHRLREAGASLIAEGRPGDDENAPAPTIFRVSSDALRQDSRLHDEVFGAAAVIVTYGSTEELERALEALGGQLTVTLQISESSEDAEFVHALLPTLERLAGRIVVNGWPTGVEVVDAMVHGGPYPATSDSKATSVGTLAIERFLRPVCYQGFPRDLLPRVLADSTVPRRVDGRLLPDGIADPS